jgi:transketolase
MLLYSMLYLTGYGLTLDDLRDFRQWESPTPGTRSTATRGGGDHHRAAGAGVRQRGGDGDGGGAPGGALQPRGARSVDHHVYAICSDGDLMEGVAAEAAPRRAPEAGEADLLLGRQPDHHRGLHRPRLHRGRAEALRRVRLAHRHGGGRQRPGGDRRGHRPGEGDPRPSMIRVRTVIGYGSPNKAGDRQGARRAAGRGGDPPHQGGARLAVRPSLPRPGGGAGAHARRRGARRADAAEWQDRFDAYAAAHPGRRARAARRRWSGTLPEGWDADLPTWSAADKPIATRAASGKALNAIGEDGALAHRRLGGPGGSNNTMIDGGSYFARELRRRNLHFGVREHAMGSLMNGMALHGGVRPYGGTFLIFSDYMRPPVPLAALMEQPPSTSSPTIRVGLGEDGPTHQPIEQLRRCAPSPGWWTCARRTPPRRPRRGAWSGLGTCLHVAGAEFPLPLAGSGRRAVLT